MHDSPDDPRPQIAVCLHVHMSLSSESGARIPVPLTDDVSLFMVIGFVDKVRDGHK